MSRKRTSARSDGMRRARSRAYSVRCSGSGPLAPNRPKKRWCSVGGASPSAGVKRASAAGANDSDGDCAKRIGSSRRRSEVPMRGRPGCAFSSRRTAWKKPNLCGSSVQLAQQLLARLVARGLGGLLLRQHLGHRRGVAADLALERAERVEDVGDGEDARAFRIVVVISPAAADASSLMAALGAQSTERAPMRGGQVLTTPRVCEASTSCVKLFMLA